MSQDLFRVMGGIQIDESVKILEGAGVPSMDAPLGSIYSDTSTGSVGYFLKIGSGAGAEKWVKLATQAYVQQFASSSISWREPVSVRVTSASLPAASVDTLDGATVVDGMRVLFSGVTGNANVFVASGTPGNWTWTEDTNLESSGDTVYVIGGTDGGKTFSYTGAGWVWISQDSSDELGFLRAFVGKSAIGNELPDYSSVNQVADGQSLETAISNLDAAIGADIAGSPNQVTAGGTVYGNIAELDAAIGADVTNGGTVLAANTVNQNIQALDSAIGAPVTTVGAVSASNTVNQNIQAVNAALLAQTNTTTGTQTATDTLPIGAEMGKWLIKIVEGGSNVRAEEVFAVTNGSTVDFTRYAALKIGSSITPFSVNVALVSGQVAITVTGPAGGSVVIKRVSVA